MFSLMQNGKQKVLYLNSILYEFKSPSEDNLSSIYVENMKKKWLTRIFYRNLETFLVQLLIADQKITNCNLSLEITIFEVEFEQKSH